MDITKRDLEQAYAQHKAQYGGSKEDYFALLYLMREFEKSPDQIARHIAFGEDVAEGINAFHVDVNRRSLYLFQFQWSAQHQVFKERALESALHARAFARALVNMPSRSSMRISSSA